MGASVNVKQVNEAGTGAKPWLTLNRLSTANFSLNLIVSGAATFDVEGTLKQLNNPTNAPEAGTPAAEDVFQIQGLTGLTASTAAKITDTPLEAIRINQTAGAGSVTLHIMQEGMI